MEPLASASDVRLIDLLKQGIASARSGDAAVARRQLLAAIGQKPDFEVPWLWLSWATADSEEATWYLRRVLAINPDHGGALELLAKLGGEAVRPAAWHCPFCGRTATAPQVRCPGCRTLFAAAEIESWLDPPPADRPLLHATVAYLESPPGRTSQPIWYWTLGVAHLNLANFPRALPYLRRAGTLSPANGSLTRLADRLESWLHREGEGPGEPAEPAAAQPEPTPVGPPEMPRTAPPPPLPSITAASAPFTPIALPAAAPAGRLVLVVDDSPTVRKIVAVTLESQGYRTVVAADGMQALAKLDEVIPDLVFLDIAMPRIDGYRVCRLIKSNAKTRHVPVVMLSGKDGFFDRIRGRAAGADGHIAKPVDRATLLGAVERWTGRRS